MRGSTQRLRTGKRVCNSLNCRGGQISYTPCVERTVDRNMCKRLPFCSKNSGPTLYVFRLHYDHVRKDDTRLSQHAHPPLQSTTKKKEFACVCRRDKGIYVREVNC